MGGVLIRDPILFWMRNVKRTVTSEFPTFWDFLKNIDDFRALTTTVVHALPLATDTSPISLHVSKSTVAVGTVTMW